MDLILRFLWRGKLLSKARWRMAQEDINAYSLFSNVQPIFGRNMEITQIVTEKGVEKIKLSSSFY